MNIESLILAGKITSKLAEFFGNYKTTIAEILTQKKFAEIFYNAKLDCIDMRYVRDEYEYQADDIFLTEIEGEKEHLCFDDYIGDAYSRLSEHF